MTQHISYPTVGTCSRQIDIELEEGVIRSVTFTGGCSGNTQGIAALVRGMKAADAVARLEGIDCRGKGTSCPGNEFCTRQVHKIKTGNLCILSGTSC